MKKTKQRTTLKILLFVLSLVLLWYMTSSVSLAAAIVAMIFLHEYGHILGAYLRGVPTHGVFFLPGLGAAAIIKNLTINSREDECFIAIVGPIVGAICSLAFYMAYVFGGWEEMLRISAILALINLFNLLPLNPLDGGRIFKSIVFSIGRRVGLFCMGLMIVGSLFFAIRYNMWLMYLVALVCYAEYREELKDKHDLTEVMLDNNEEKWRNVKNVDIVDGDVFKPSKLYKDGQEVRIIAEYERKRMSAWKIIYYGVTVFLLIAALLVPVFELGEENKEKEEKKELPTEEVIEEDTNVHVDLSQFEGYEEWDEKHQLEVAMQLLLAGVFVTVQDELATGDITVITNPNPRYISRPISEVQRKDIE